MRVFAKHFLPAHLLMAEMALAKHSPLIATGADVVYDEEVVQRALKDSGVLREA
jgi:hypothetical protein